MPVRRVWVCFRNVSLLVALASAGAAGTGCSRGGPAVPPPTGGSSGRLGGDEDGGRASGGASGGSAQGGISGGGGNPDSGAGGAGIAGAAGSASSSSGGTTGAGGMPTVVGGASGIGGSAASGGNTAAGGSAGAGQTGGAGQPTGGAGGSMQAGMQAGSGGMDTGATGGVNGTGGTAGATGTGGIGGASCDPTASTWQRVLSCDIVAPGNIFHACIDYFASANSADIVRESETAACTDQGGTPLTDVSCAAASSLGGCIDAIDAVVSSDHAEYSRTFQYPGMNVNTAIVAAGCADDGLPYVSATADPSTGAPPFTCP
jgi:hypothetical protein